MKTVTNLEVSLTTEDPADAEAVRTIVDLMLARFKRSIEASSPKVRSAVFETTIEEAGG